MNKQNSIKQHVIRFYGEVSQCKDKDYPEDSEKGYASEIFFYKNKEEMFETICLTFLRKV